MPAAEAITNKQTEAKKEECASPASRLAHLKGNAYHSLTQPTAVLGVRIVNNCVNASLLCPHHRQLTEQQQQAEKMIRKLVERHLPAHFVIRLLLLYDCFFLYTDDTQKSRKN